MGCCLSSAGEECHCSYGGATLEEEAVKEVLLETPFCSRKQNTDEFNDPGKQDLKVDGGRGTTDVLIQTNPGKLYPTGNVSEEVSNDTGCYCDRAGDEKSDGEVNQRCPLRARRQPVGSKSRVPARTPVAPEKTIQVKPFRGGKLRNEGSVHQRSRSPINRGGRGTRRSLRGETENSGWSNDVVLGEETETLENPVVSLECFIFL